MAEDWQKLDSEKTARILDEINQKISPVPFGVESTTLRYVKLPFYKDYQFYELTDVSSVPAARKYALYKPGDVHVMDWTNQPIYDVNEKAPLILNEKTVAAYVRFFFQYVRGRNGRFVIVEGIEDIRWQVEPPAQGRKVMQDMLTPVEVTQHNNDNSYELESFIIFKDSLFKTKIHVQPDGLISMSDEELKIEGMPVLNDTAV